MKEKARGAVGIAMACGLAAGMIGCATEDLRTQESLRSRVTLQEPAGPAAAPVRDAAAERKILDVLDEMYRNQRQGMLNAPPEDCRLIRILVEATRARHVVEIGTSNGYSALWICLGLRATGGHLTTYEIDPRRAALARANFERAGVSRLVTLVEGDAHREVGKVPGPIDLVFIDADKTGYVDYLNKLLPRVRPGGLILAHNTGDCAKDLQDYVRAVTTDPDLETVILNHNDRGMAVTMKR